MISYMENKSMNDMLNTIQKELNLPKNAIVLMCKSWNSERISRCYIACKSLGDKRVLTLQ